MYKKNNKIKFTVCLVLISLFLCCCKNNAVKDIKQNVVVNHCDTVFIHRCDTMVYKLSDKATNAILKMIKDKCVSHCGLVVNYDNDERVFSFSFSYDDITSYSKRDTILLQRTNIFLDLNGKKLPVITEFDDLFSDIPEQSYSINDFNFCFVDVNVRGDLLNSFAY